MNGILLPLVVVAAALVHRQCVLGQDWWPPRPERRHHIGELSTLFTAGLSPDNHYNIWYVVEDRFSFVFSVKACRNAVLALSQEMDATDDFTVELIIGDQYNNQTGLRYPSQIGYITRSETPDVLHCDEYRKFWLSWDFNVVQFGRGPTIGIEELLSWSNPDPNPRVLLSIGLNSIQTSALWQVHENTAEYLHISLEKELLLYSTLWKQVSTKKFFSFSAKGCYHSIVLTQTFGDLDKNLYEVVIGADNNSESLIRTVIGGDGDTIKARHNQLGMANCAAPLQYWVSWNDGVIEVGTGIVYGLGRFLRWKDDTPIDVRHISFSPGFQHDGYWYFTEDMEPTTTVFTRPTNETEMFEQVLVTSPRKEFFIFQHTTCPLGELHIELKSYSEDNSIVKLILGANQNTKVILRVNEEIHTFDIQNSVTCDVVTPNWLTWHNGVIELGPGVVYGTDKWFSVAINTVSRIQAIALTTPNTSGLVHFRDDSGERVKLVTPAASDHYDQMIRTVANQEYVNFRLRACEEGHVTLLPVPGIGDNDYYDLVISEGGNRTYVRKVTNTNITTAHNVTDMVETSGLLSCDYDTDFWLSWWDGKPTLGRGYLPGHDAIISLEVEDLPYVGALSVSTGGSSNGLWTFEEENGDELYYQLGTQSIIVIDQDITWIKLSFATCGKSFSIELIELTQSDDPLSGGFECYKFQFDKDFQTVTLRIRGTHVASEPIGDLISCDDERDVWVSWQGQQLAIGTSSIPGQNQILQYANAEQLNLTVNAISMYHKPRETRGHWRSLENVGLKTVFILPGTSEMAKTRIGESSPHLHLPVYRSVRHRSSLRFAVMGCSEARLILLSRGLSLTEDLLEARIGSKGNTRTEIGIFGADAVYSMPTPHILHCDELRSFWISWTNGGIEIGEGDVVFEGKILSFYTPRALHVDAVGFSNHDSRNSTWSILLANDTFPTVSPPTVTGPPPQGGGGLSPGAIAGIVIGSIIATLMIMLLVHLVMKWRSALGLPTLRISRRNESNQPQLNQERNVMPDLPVTVMTEPYDRFN